MKLASVHADGADRLVMLVDGRLVDLASFTQCPADMIALIEGGLVERIAADSLGAQLGAIPWAISRHFVDEAVLVSDDEIRAAQKALWTDLRLVAEPGGAAAYAAVLSGAVKQQEGERLVVVVCGSNCDPASVV